MPDKGGRYAVDAGFFIVVSAKLVGRDISLCNTVETNPLSSELSLNLPAKTGLDRSARTKTLLDDLTKGPVAAENIEHVMFTWKALTLN